MSEEHIATVTRLFGDFTEAELVTVFDAAGQAQGEPQLVTGTDTMPTAPEGGKLKRVPISRLFKNEDFGYTTITVERPLKDEAGQPVLRTKGKKKGKPLPDSALRDTENARRTSIQPTLQLWGGVAAGMVASVIQQPATTAAPSHHGTPHSSAPRPTTP